MMNSEINKNNNEIRDVLIRYFTFWPWYLISVIFFLSASYIYLRYTDYLYNSSSTIEILDKSQESEMSLPTSMTVFNRKMVNLDNEIGVLKSYSLHEQAVLKTKLNFEYYKQGVIKESRIDFEELLIYLDNFKLFAKPEEITIGSYYQISSNDGKIKISHYNLDDSLINEYDYNNLSSEQNNSVLPFYFEKTQKSNFSILIYFKNFSRTVNSTRKRLVVEPASRNGGPSSWDDLSSDDERIKRIKRTYLSLSLFLPLSLFSAQVYSF